MKNELNYLTEKEAKMPLDMALLQIALGLQTCKTKGDVRRLLMDGVVRCVIKMKYTIEQVKEAIKHSYEHNYLNEYYIISNLLRMKDDDERS